MEINLKREQQRTFVTSGEITNVTVINDSRGNFSKAAITLVDKERDVTNFIQYKKNKEFALGDVVTIGGFCNVKNGNIYYSGFWTNNNKQSEKLTFDVFLNRIVADLGDSVTASVVVYDNYNKTLEDIDVVFTGNKAEFIRTQPRGKGLILHLSKQQVGVPTDDLMTFDGKAVQTNKVALVVDNILLAKNGDNLTEEQLDGRQEEMQEESSTNWF